MPIVIGDMTQVGSGVQILTVGHPRDPTLRRRGNESDKPGMRGANVWIGASALILPGVTIGADAIVRAASVATRDVPRVAVVMRDPARRRLRMMR